MVHSISWTTRAKRPLEMEGGDYHFVDGKTFEKGIQESIFAEWAKVHNANYGTPKAFLEKNIQEGLLTLLDIDVQGGMSLKKLYPKESVSIFLLPPSEEELVRRLEMRKTDDLQTRQLRLKNAKWELTFQDAYDYRVINLDLDKTCEEIEKILTVR